MAITWKKLAQYNAEGTKIEGTITGKALGGVTGVMSLANGGTGTDMTSGAEAGSLIASTGAGMEYTERPTAANQIMVSNGSNSWTWMGIEESHNHDTAYINKVSAEQQSMSGSLMIDGALEVTGSVEFHHFDEIATATINNGVLGLGSAGNGNNSGFYIDSDSSGNFGNGDPCIVWKADYESTGAGTWVGGKYDDQRALITFQQSINESSTPDIPGMLGANDSGELFISLKTS